MPSNTARIQVGRLLEVRVDAGYRSAAEVDLMFQAVGREVRKLAPKQRHVTVVDWRRCSVMSPDAAERLRAAISGTNPLTERSAALATTESPIAVLQFVRVIRDAGFADRRLFFNAVELIDWVKEVLDPAELSRMREFLSEPRGT